MVSSSEGLSHRAGDSVDLATPTRLERFSRRLGVAALLALGPAAILYLAFSKGGYFPNTQGFAAIIFAQALVLRTTLSEHPFEGYNGRFALALIALTLLAAQQLASALWSHSTALALDSYTLTLLYLLAFALLGSLPRSWLRLRWLVYGLAVVLTAVCLAGLISRVLPHVLPTEGEGYSARLAYPLSYWNALGVTAAMATVLLVHLSSSLREPRVVRILAAMSVPATAATLLLTYSRGAIVVAIMGLVLYALVGRARALLSSAIAILPAAAIALRTAYDATLLSSDTPRSAAAIVQGRHVALMVGIGILTAGVLRAVLSLRIDRWLARPHSLPERMRRQPRWALLGGPALLVVIVLVALGAPSYFNRQYHRFADVNAAPSQTQVRSRLTSAASNGRVALWSVATQQFDAHPFIGEGAGTFQSYWDRHRPETDNVVDAHNLYLQTLGEQGVLGLALLLVVLLSILVTLALRCRGSERSLYAALLAVVLVWAVHAGVDWDWQMPAVTITIFILGGAALASTDTEAGPRALSRPRNATLIAVALLALAVAPLFVGVSYQRLQAAAAALRDGHCPVAKQRALSSISLLSVRPEAYEVLGYCDLEQGFPAEGLAAMRKAETYEPGNWNFHYGLAIALAADQLDPRAQARRTLQLNPHEALAINAARAFYRAPPGQWQLIAVSVMHEGLHSGSLSLNTL